MKKLTKGEIFRLLSQNRELLSRYRIKKIRLFGSYVRNEQTDESDIDFLVEFESPISIFEHVHLINELAQIFGKKVEVLSVKALKPLLSETILKEAEEL